MQHREHHEIPSLVCFPLELVCMQRNTHNTIFGESKPEIQIRSSSVSELCYVSVLLMHKLNLSDQHLSWICDYCSHKDLLSIVMHTYSMKIYNAAMTITS